MKISPPIILLKYIDIQDGRVVPARPIPKILKRKFERFCKRFEATYEKYKKQYDKK